MDPAREALRAALLRHRPADAEEASHRDAILRLVEEAPRCFARDHYLPGHITGSAFVVCARSGKVLLHHHRRLGRWLQLGGHDDGESAPALTALREAREESGLADLRLLTPEILDVDVHEIPAARGEPSHRHHDVRYLLVTEQAGAIARDEAESIELAWFTPEEAVHRMGEAGARRAIGRLRALIAAS